MTAETQEPAERMRFVTVLRPHRADDRPPMGAEVEMTDGGCAVRAEVDGGEVIAVWGDGEGGAEGFGLTTDGTVAAMRVTEDGEPDAWMVQGGSDVDYDG
jgi:hypothetical protein